MRRRFLGVMLAATVAACSSPVPNLYTLAAVPGMPLSTRKLAVELRRISLAGYLDRAEIVRGTAGYQLQVSDIDRWGEPLGRMLERVLTENLVTRLPGAAVFAESGAISTKPDLVVEIDIQRLEPDQQGSVVLLAQIAVRPERGTAMAETVRLKAPLADPTSTQAQVAGMSAALGLLADAVAAILAR